MNQQDIEVFKTLGRINRFSFTHGGALPAGSIAGTQFARCITLVGEIGPASQLADVGDTAQTRALIKEGRALIKSLNTSIRNFFRAHPAILAEWRTASRIRQTGGSGEPEETIPATPATATP